MSRLDGSSVEQPRRHGARSRGQNGWPAPFPSFLASIALFISLLALTTVSGAAGSGGHDLSGYPWVYLRDGESLGVSENVVEMVAVGDVMLGRDVGRGSLDHIQAWLRAADLAVGNLESVIVDAPGSSPARSGGEEGRFLLRAPASAATELRRAGFGALGLANNHALDFGAGGLQETVSHLEGAGIAAVGVGLDESTALRPLVRDIRGVRLALLAFNGVSAPQPDVADRGWTPAVWNEDRAAVTVASVKDRVDAVIVSIHWGYEYQTRADPAQRDAARALLEAGADLVIGHHPHVAQAFESDGRSAVAYSLGNLVFDQGREGTQQGLVLRAFFDTAGLRAVQALPVWAGPRPRLMSVEEAHSLLQRVNPSSRRLSFTCDGDGCRALDAPREPLPQGPSGTFWGGAIDLTGDGRPEHVRRVSDQVIIYRDGTEAWRSPPSWHVPDLALGDPNDDGRGELVLALWKPGLDGLEPPDPVKQHTPRSRPFIVGYRGGTYRTLWGGSAVSEPIQEVELGDVDGDGVQELVVLEGDEPRRRTIAVWRWHGWGFSLVWRSDSGPWRDLILTGDGLISVAVD